MTKIVTFLKNFFYAEIGPTIIGIFFLAFIAYYWAVGLLFLSLLVLIIIVNGLGALILSAFFRKKPAKTRVIITSAYTAFICITLLVLQFYTSRKEQLKTPILTQDIKNDFEIEKARVFYPAFEEEIYVKLKSSPKLTQEYLASREFGRVSQEDILNPSLSPSWFPANEFYNDFEIYQYDFREYEALIIAFVSKDKDEIFAWYLSY